MSLAKKIGKNQKSEINHHKAIIMELLRNIYGLGVVLDDMAAGKVSEEEHKKVKSSIKDLLDSFNVKVKEESDEKA